MKKLNMIASLQSIMKIKKNYCLGYQALHDEYGDTVLITFPIKLLVTRRADVIDEILKSDFETFCRSHLLSKAYGPLIKNGILSQEGEKWKNQRRGAVESLHLAKSSNKKEIANNHIKLLIPKKKHDHLNFSIIAQNFAFQNINKLIFENKFSDDQEYFKEVIDKSLTILSKKQKDPLFYSRKDYNRAMKDLEKVENIILDKIEDQGLLSHSKGRDSNSKKEFVGQVMNMLAAGYETTAATAIWCLYFIIKNNVKKENLKQAIFETLRVIPAVGVILRRSKINTSVKGIEISKGTEISCNLYSLHRSEEHWDRPNEFLLNRNYDNHLTYKPFGGGPTVCPGKALSLLELEVMLSYLLDNFEISFSNDSMDDFLNFRTDGTVKPARDLYIQLIPLD